MHGPGCTTVNRSLQSSYIAAAAFVQQSKTSPRARLDATHVCQEEEATIKREEGREGGLTMQLLVQERACLIDR